MRTDIAAFVDGPPGGVLRSVLPCSGMDLRSPRDVLG